MVVGFEFKPQISACAAEQNGVNSGVLYWPFRSAPEAILHVAPLTSLSLLRLPHLFRQPIQSALGLLWAMLSL